LVPLSNIVMGNPGLSPVPPPGTTNEPVKVGNLKSEAGQPEGRVGKLPSRDIVIDCTVTGTVRLLCTVKTRHRVAPGYRRAVAPEHAGESKMSLVTVVPVSDVRVSFGDEG
jgi:hypothetical protein